MISNPVIPTPKPPIKMTCKLTKFEVRLITKSYQGKLTREEKKDMRALIAWLELFI